jgi:RNA polymerase sigma-70 factor (ECF subfamily)
MLLRKSNRENNEEEMPDAAEKLRNGSAEAFKILYNFYSQKVYRYCLRFLGDSALAEDAFQESFIRVYENRENFHGDNFGAWLYTISRNTCMNYLRVKKEHDEFNEVFHGHETHELSDSSIKENIDKAISQLPDALREAFLLREYEEMSYQEISEILNIDLSLAKVRVYRARIILRKLLKPLVKELNES